MQVVRIGEPGENQQGMHFLALYFPGRTLTVEMISSTKLKKLPEVIETTDDGTTWELAHTCARFQRAAVQTGQQN